MLNLLSMLFSATINAPFSYDILHAIAQHTIEWKHFQAHRHTYASIHFLKNYSHNAYIGEEIVLIQQLQRLRQDYILSFCLVFLVSPLLESYTFFNRFEKDIWCFNLTFYSQEIVHYQSFSRSIKVCLSHTFVKEVLQVHKDWHTVMD